MTVAGVGGIPGSGPAAIIATLTAVSASQVAYLAVYPADVSPKPNASHLKVHWACLAQLGGGWAWRREPTSVTSSCSTPSAPSTPLFEVDG